MDKSKLIMPISILLGCLILGGFFYASQINKQQSIEEQQQIDLKAKTDQQQAEKTNNNDFDLQQKCSQQAKTFFDYYVSDPESKKTAELSNHYNVKLNKCFALIKQYIQTGTGASFSAGNQEDLYDAVEKKVYGSYSWMSQSPKKYWEVAPLWCDTYKDGDKYNHQVCNTEDEFDNFVSPYMNE
jgi:hypothetical protein